MTFGLSYFMRSKARFAVLRALWLAGRPLRFREIVAREALGIRSVQVEIRQLIRLRIVRRMRDRASGRPAYAINREHEVGELITELIALEDRHILRERGQSGAPQTRKRIARLSGLRKSLIKLRSRTRGTSRTIEKNRQAA